MSEQKKTFDKEIKDSEQAVAEQESELKELRKNAISFPKELEKAVATATKNLSDKLNVEFEFKIQLTNKETEGELNLKIQKITDLQEKVADLIAHNKLLQSKVEKAEQDAKEITIKAIETSGTKPMIMERSIRKEEKE